MKAAVHYQYGPPDVVQLADFPQPIPKDDEVLVKVRAASLNPVDWRVISGGGFFLHLLLRLLTPKVKRLGTDVAGEVEAVGRSVTRFRPGDAVFGACRGALAEYACASESKLAHKPDALTFEQVASAPVAALTALQGLRDYLHIQPGQKVLINGASGGVGTFSVQFAKDFGAEVTGVCSTRNVEMVRSLGADRVIDYTREDFAADTQRYDLMLDNAGRRSLAECKRALKPGGRCVVVGGPKDLGPLLVRVLQVLVLSRLGHTFDFFTAKVDPADLSTIADLMAAGKVNAVIDRRYPLSEVVEALRYAIEGHARGKIVIILE